MIKLYIPLISVMLLINGCSSQQYQHNTLRDIDITNSNKKQDKVFIKPKSVTDIREAYAEYLKHASKDDYSRLDAINRLAELEFDLSNKLQNETQIAKSEQNNDHLYNERLDKTIELLSTSLKDYPDAKGNDKIMYQLAKAYDHRGEHENSEKVLIKLVKKYPKSAYYIESQFRLAEILFSKRNYVKAEDTYTDIIGSAKNNVFYEKALFKRGWARFKQEYYLEAVDDYLAAVDYHNFDDYSELSQHQLDQFNEYFRAIGLSFSYLGGAEPLNEYFKENPSFQYIYHSYSHVSDIYLKQQRFSDAVNTLKYFIANNKKSKKLPLAYLKIVNIWKESGLANKAADEINVLYEKYHPNNQYWLSNNSDQKTYKRVIDELKGNILLAAAYFHKQYTQKNKQSYFVLADKWYKRYLNHFKAHARKDDVHYQYASLLEMNNQSNEALYHYEIAAYDEEIILHKNAAYATILLSNKIYKKTKLKDDKVTALNKHIKYATLYSQLYSNSKNTSKIMLHAAELAFQTKQYTKAIELVESIANKNKAADSIKANIIKAHSYFNLGEYENAEAVYSSILASSYTTNISRQQLTDKLALSIYKQAEIEVKKGNIEPAIGHFTRISNIVPSSQISSTGFYDAIALSMKHKLWSISISNIQKFQKLYPGHKYNNDVTKKLSVAYLNSNQDIKAAKEFEKISGFENNQDVKIAALWQAAELYESKNDLQSAIRSYEKYTKKYKKPFPQYMEAMKKLSDLYSTTNNTVKAQECYKNIIDTDKKTTNKNKTDRTRYITSYASLTLAKSEHKIFNQLKLVLPLKLSLRKKKYAMQKAVKYYGQASKYGVAETTTESTNAIADIYKTFSKDLLTSQRPEGLSNDELEQYIILLEDKAFPFEDKAIEFYEANMTHIKDGVYNKWVKQSHTQLRTLFPTRYNRAAKLDRYINAIH